LPKFSVGIFISSGKISTFLTYSDSFNICSIVFCLNISGGNPSDNKPKGLKPRFSDKGGF